jgi:hypothetical protein
MNIKLIKNVKLISELYEKRFKINIKNKFGITISKEYINIGKLSLNHLRIFNQLTQFDADKSPELYEMLAIYQYLLSDIDSFSLGIKFGIVDNVKYFEYNKYLDVYFGSFSIKPGIDYIRLNKYIIKK